MKNKLTQLFVLHFFNDGFLASIILLLPFIKQDLNLNLTQVGFLTSLLSASGIILALPAGHLGYKIGGLRILSLILFFFAIGFVAIGFSPSYYFLILSFSLIALGFGIFHPIAFSLVTKWSDPKKIGRSMGDFTAIGDVGRIVLSSLAPFIIVYIGWRSTSFIYGIIALFFFIFILIIRNRNNKVSVEENKIQMNLWQIIKNKKFIYALLTSFFDNLSSSALFAFLPFLLLKRNIDPSLLGVFSGTFLVGNLLGKVSLGRLADSFKNTTVFIVAEFLMAVFIILLTISSSQFFIIIFSIILGILTAGTIPVRTTLISESTIQIGQHEKVFSIASLIATTATSLAPILLGRIADLYGIVSSFYMAGLLALMAILPTYLFSKLKANKSSLLY